MFTAVAILAQASSIFVSPEILCFSMHNFTITSMVSFVVKNGGCVDWDVFSTKFEGVKAKSLHKFFDIKPNGERVEVRNKKARRRSTQVQCTSQVEESLSTQRDSRDDSGKISIPYGSKVLVPALLSSLSPEATEFLVVLLYTAACTVYCTICYPRFHCFPLWCLLV